MSTESKRFPMPSNQTLLLIASIVLLLALVCVSAFAYTWSVELKDVKAKNATLRAQASSFSSLTDELSEARLTNYSLASELEAISMELADLKASLDATPAPDGQ